MISEATTARGGARTVPRFVVPRLTWQQVGLGLTLLIAAFLNCWQLAKEGYANAYYAATVRSMLTSWHNFLFVSFDPGGFVTVDKPPLGFWIQAAFAKLFGFHGWALLLPEAVAGVCSVALLYHLVRRVFGATAGLTTAFILAVTPISVVTNRNNTIDALLALTVLLAVWVMAKATETGKIRWLLTSMTLVGLGFNIKMLEAYLVLPALVLVYLVGVNHSWRKRIGHLAIATVVLLAVSLSWATAVDLTPASARPYVGSTQNNSELSLALGYNGLQRLLGNQMGPGNGARPDDGQRATTQMSGADQTADGASAVPTGQSPNAGQQPGNPPAGSGVTGDDGSGRAAGVFPNGQPPAPNGGFPVAGPGGGGPGGVGENGPKGILRLFDQQLGGQIAWLLPLALVGLVGTGGWLFRRQRVGGSEHQAAEIGARERRGARIMRVLRTPLNPRQQAVVLWGTWTLTMGAFFSIAGFYHRYYLSMLAPGIAALVGIGIAALWQAYQRRHVLGWLLPVALLGTAAVQAKILADYPVYARWMTPVILGTSAVAAIALVLARVRPVNVARRRLALGAATLGLCALLVGPTVWSAVSVQAGGGGGLPAAGPQMQGQEFPGGMPGGGAPGGGPPGDMGGQTNSALISFLEANRGNATFLVAVPSSQGADSIIIATGEPVMAMGGFSGSDPILTASGMAQRVHDGAVRYVLLGGNGPGGGFGGQGGQASATQWVTSNCTAVPSSAYQASTSSTGARFGGGQQLYDCGRAATQG